MALCVLILPTQNKYFTKVDLVECNTVYGPDAFPMFTQMIYWNYSEFHNDYVVVAWKLNNEVWVETKEHKEKWLKALREYCDKYPQINYLQARHRYRGDYDPVPGLNFPMKKLNKLTGKNYWEMVFYSDGKRIVVHAPLFRETHTQNDPERDNRSVLDGDNRLGLNGFGRSHLHYYNQYYESK